MKIISRKIPSTDKPLWIRGSVLDTQRSPGNKGKTSLIEIHKPVSLDGFDMSALVVGNRPGLGNVIQLLRSIEIKEGSPTHPKGKSTPNRRYHGTDL